MNPNSPPPSPPIDVPITLMGAFCIVAALFGASAILSTITVLLGQSYLAAEPLVRRDELWEYALFGVPSAVIVGVTQRAWRRSRQTVLFSSPRDHGYLRVFVLSAPLLLLVGAIVGVLSARSMLSSRRAIELDLAQSACRDAYEVPPLGEGPRDPSLLPPASTRDACPEVALRCVRRQREERRRSSIEPYWQRGELRCTREALRVLGAASP